MGIRFNKTHQPLGSAAGVVAAAAAEDALELAAELTAAAAEEALELAAELTAALAELGAGVEVAAAVEELAV